MNSLAISGSLSTAFTVRSRTSRKASSRSVVVKVSASQNALEAAKATPELSSLCQALQSVDLASALEGEGPFTILAPTNAAFATFCDERGISSAQIIEGQNFEDKKEMVEALLKYHVIPGETMGADQVKSSEVTTLQGRSLEKLDGAEIVKGDIEVSNGVIHEVDQVLVPPFVVNAKIRPMGEIMTMEGWAPEVINGRLAMLGFTLAVMGEFSTQQTFLSQLFGNFGGFVFALGLWTLASAAPALNSSMGYTADPNSMANSKEWKTIMKGGPWPLVSGIFTPEVEKLNGQAAMVGILGLILIELFKGSALF